MVPFLLILIVCGEFTPLVVLALGSRVTPLTCRVPKQLEKERQARIERKKEAVRIAEMSSAVEADLKEWNAIALLKAEPDRESESVRGVMCSCAALGLAKSHRVPSYVPGFMEKMAVNGVYVSRLKRYKEYLAVDDALIKEYGGVRGLSPEELRIAVDERGGVDVAMEVVKEDEKEKTMRRWLQRWIDGKA